MVLLDIPIKIQNTVRCPKCFKQTAERSARCEHCDRELTPARPKTLFGKIKRLLGIDLSDIVTINLEESERFFTNQEIESLLKMENITWLDLEDVPDYATIFYKSRRIRKPNNRRQK
jgi:hypothetical protein